MLNNPNSNNNYNRVPSPTYNINTQNTPNDMDMFSNIDQTSNIYQNNDSLLNPIPPSDTSYPQNNNNNSNNIYERRPQVNFSYPPNNPFSDNTPINQPPPQFSTNQTLYDDFPMNLPQTPTEYVNQFTNNSYEIPESLPFNDIYQDPTQDNGNNDTNYDSMF